MATPVLLYYVGNLGHDSLVEFPYCVVLLILLRSLISFLEKRRKKHNFFFFLSLAVWEVFSPALPAYD